MTAEHKTHMGDENAIKSWAASHVGTFRKHNEDNLISRPELGLWAVADGAGGHQAGEVASGAIVAAIAKLPAAMTVPDLITELRRDLSEVNQDMRTQAAARGEGAMIASTFVALIVRDGHYTCLWAGDSRAYLWRAGSLRQISRDHSLVQELIDTGHLTPAAAERHPHANIITRAVGADTELELDQATGNISPGDILLLCTDGLNKTLNDADLSHILATRPLSPADALIEAALARKATDNVTAIVIAV
jgi:protein phosphatase/serine/threonine-protein phosphatase Stp1